MRYKLRTTLHDEYHVKRDATSAMADSFVEAVHVGSGLTMVASLIRAPCVAPSHRLGLAVDLLVDANVLVRPNYW